MNETVRVVALFFFLVGLVACRSDSTGAGRPATTDLTLEDIAQSLRDADLGCVELWTDADDDLPRGILTGECVVMAETISIYVTDSRPAKDALVSFDVPCAVTSQIQNNGFVNGTNWWVVPQNAATARAIGDALDAKVQTFGCR